MLQRLKNATPAFVAGLLPIASALVTVSGTNVSLDPSEITTFGNGVTGMGASVLKIFIDLAPYLLGVAAIFLVIGWLKGVIKRKGH